MSPAGPGCVEVSGEGANLTAMAPISTVEAFLADQEKWGSNAQVCRVMHRLRWRQPALFGKESSYTLNAGESLFWALTGVRQTIPTHLIWSEIALSRFEC